MALPAHSALSMSANHAMAAQKRYRASEGQHEHTHTHNQACPTCSGAAQAQQMPEDASAPVGVATPPQPTAVAAAGAGAAAAVTGAGAAAAGAGTAAGPSGLKLQDAEFSYPGHAPFIREACLDLPRGSRCLLIGANGAGKTTLLQIAAGKYMVAERMVQVLGRPPFHDMVSLGHTSSTSIAPARGAAACAHPEAPGGILRLSCCHTASARAGADVQRAAELPGHVVAKGRGVCGLRRAAAGGL